MLNKQLENQRKVLNNLLQLRNTTEDHIKLVMNEINNTKKLIYGEEMLFKRFNQDERLAEGLRNSTERD